MRYILAAVLLLFALPASACGLLVCLVDPQELVLPEQITFDDAQAGAGPGHHVDGVLALAGAQFGERFAGQALRSSGAHDTVEGTALAPLTVLAGASGQNLSVVRMMGSTIMTGYGHLGFPKRDAQGEGAIAVLFDEDQSALSIHIRGGEKGRAEVTFLRRNGSVLAQVPVDPIGEYVLGFLRTGGTADIAGLVLTNTDPQGLALDTIRFGKVPELG